MRKLFIVLTIITFCLLLPVLSSSVSFAKVIRFKYPEAGDEITAKYLIYACNFPDNTEGAMYCMSFINGFVRGVTTGSGEKLICSIKKFDKKDDVDAEERRRRRRKNEYDSRLNEAKHLLNKFVSKYSEALSKPARDILYVSIAEDMCFPYGQDGKTSDGGDPMAEDLLEFCNKEKGSARRKYCRGFMEGYWEGVTVASDGALVCRQRGDIAMSVYLFNEFANINPDLLNQPARQFIYYALSDFLCKKPETKPESPK